MLSNLVKNGPLKNFFLSGDYTYPKLLSKLHKLNFLLDYRFLLEIRKALNKIKDVGKKKKKKKKI